MSEIESTRPAVLVLTSEALFPHFFPDPVRARLTDISFWELLTEREDTPRLREGIGAADALITTWHSPFLRADMFGGACRVKLIAHCGGEVKSRMDKAVFNRVLVTNTPDPMAPPAAEMAVAMALSLVRRLPEYEGRMRTGLEVDNRIATEGETLFGRSVGIVGFGRIGRVLAHLLEPFRLDLLVADPYCDDLAIHASKARRAELDDLLKSCSVVFLAAGLTPQSRGILNARRLSLLPNGACLINVARGGLLDMAALVRELKSGRIRAALDVTDPEEPLPQDHELRRLENVLLTPHVAAGGIEVRRAMGATAVEAVAAFFSGETPANVVRREMLAHMT